jgi:hypothetical protein
VNELTLPRPPGLPGDDQAATAFLTALHGALSTRLGPGFSGLVVDADRCTLYSDDPLDEQTLTPFVAGFTYVEPPPPPEPPAPALVEAVQAIASAPDFATAKANLEALIAPKPPTV